jgi:hypothetical protein
MTRDSSDLDDRTPEELNLFLNTAEDAKKR